VGRGLRMAASAVKQRALDEGLALYQPVSLKSEDTLERVREARADAMVVAAYGMILPQRYLDACPYGALNIHASLLPRWRGAAPIQRAILAGDAETGISIMKMDAGLDTGPVLTRRAIPILPDDDFGTLHDRLATLGASLIVQTLQDLERGDLREEPQPADGVTYAAKITRADTVLDWTRPAIELDRAVRAFRPAPGATTQLRGEPLKVWRASAVEGTAPPGEIVVEGAAVMAGCGFGRLRIDEVQKAGGKRMSVAEFMRGTKVEPGSRFG
jgi:methionyl-tRNA formyltransferase